jgi:hypothetical protein
MSPPAVLIGAVKLADTNDAMLVGSGEAFAAACSLVGLRLRVTGSDMQRALARALDRHHADQAAVSGEIGSERSRDA